MNPYEPARSRRRSTPPKLDWPEQARTDGWVLAQGNGSTRTGPSPTTMASGCNSATEIWEDAHIASLAVDEQRELLKKYGDALSATAAALRQEQAAERRRDQTR